MMRQSSVVLLILIELISSTIISTNSGDNLFSNNSVNLTDNLFRVNATFKPEKTVAIWDGPPALIEFNITYYISKSDIEKGSRFEDYSLRVKSTYEEVMVVSNTSSATLLEDCEGWCEINDLTVEIRGKRLGEAWVQFGFVKDGENFTTNTSLLPFEYYVQVKRPKTVHDMIFHIIVSLCVILITFFMGCELDLKIIINYLKRPIAPVIGIVCQYIFMPIIAFTITRIIDLKPEFGFGMLVIGCSPGGGNSNMWTLLFGGDLNLSMTMTFLSTMLALGAMPLWLFAFGRFFMDYSRVQIPYGMITLQLVQVVVPCGIGIIVRNKAPKVADKFAKAIKIFAILMLVFMFSYGIYTNLYMFKLMGAFPILFPIASCLPWLGFAAGFLLALVCRQTRAQQIAICIETGIQNNSIAILILLYSMPFPMGELGAVMAITVALFTPFPLYIGGLIVLFKKLYVKIKKKRRESIQKHGEKKLGMLNSSDYETNEAVDSQNDPELLQQKIPLMEVEYEDKNSLEP